MPAPKLSLSMFYNASRLRTDTWDQLKVLARRLHETARRGADLGPLRRKLDDCLARLDPLEAYFAYPGHRTMAELARLARPGHEGQLARAAAHLCRMLVSDAYRSLGGRARRSADLETLMALEESQRHEPDGERGPPRPYFEVLVVGDLGEDEEQDLREQLLAQRDRSDEFVYDIIVVPSFEDALIAVLLNVNVQSVLLRAGFPVESSNRFDILRELLGPLDDDLDPADETATALALAQSIRRLRPTLDQFLVTDAPVEEVAGQIGRDFRRVFYRHEDYLELHLSLLKGVRERFEAPFFNALKKYSQRPTGVFHALPISRGKSITKSHWIRDMAEFYGHKIFLAETSATTGGLDSLLQPHGPIKRAQLAAARAFGAQRTYFVTNGTSTANKIVLQSLVRPGDIVLVSHDCHKSHHYTMMLTGTQPLYMDPYPLPQYSMYGAVPLRVIKQHLLDLKKVGELHRVKMLLLTNCTFDGVVYNPRRVMREVLAIKPDITFVWDEAWYAFAGFSPMTRRRTAMAAADELRRTLRSPEYRERYAAWRTEHDARDPSDDATWLDHALLPDPEVARVRVYATQSTHKTLTSLRQGSMIHVYDQDFHAVEDAFRDAYMTHTSTSPNYQILASLDVGRRQLELEGYEFVRGSVGLAMMIRKQIVDHPLLSKYFRVLRSGEMIPAELRPSGVERFYDPDAGFTRIDEHWASDEFALDPTRVTVHVGATGLTGDQFRKLLIERHDIQINKTSRNTVLFMLNIGSSRGSATYLLDVLLQIAEEIEERRDEASEVDRVRAEGLVQSLVAELPPLPRFSRFHPAFADDDAPDTREGDMRRAFFLAYDQAMVEHIPLDGSVTRVMASGRTLVSAAFVTPYPPGFPILVPGQILTEDIVQFLRAVDVKEIHGYDAVNGLKIFTDAALAATHDPSRT
jgi:arginine decarboxylase